MSIRPQIGLAYLLARAADTIADTGIVAVPERLAALQAFRQKVLGTDLGPFRLNDFIAHQGSPGERSLLERLGGVLGWLEQLDSADRQLVREVLDTISSGQELDLQRFAYANTACIIPLQTDADLDDYTYRVAGCVGEFWTKMCRAHAFPSARLDDAALLTAGVRFGKGLQLVNILRDLPADLRRGRCYLPLASLSELEVKPADLLLPKNEIRVRPVYDDYLRRAEAHLAAGWSYTNALPWRAVRVRLACAWPILIGMRTLARLKTGPILDPAEPIKIRRKEIRSLILRSVVLYPFPRVWRGIFRSGGT